MTPSSNLPDAGDPATVAEDVELGPAVGLSGDQLEERMAPLLKLLNDYGREGASLQDATPFTYPPQTTLSFVARATSPYGLTFVTFRLVSEGLFQLTVQIEGELGDLSFAAYHPNVLVQGDAAAAADWLSRLSKSGLRSGGDGDFGGHRPDR